MRIPVDTKSITFLAASAPERAVDYDSRQPKVEEDGRPLFVVSLVALDSEGAQVIPVKVPGEPKGIAQGTSVTVTNLVASPWAIGEKSGVSFRAERIEPASGSARQAA